MDRLFSCLPFFLIGVVLKSFYTKLGWKVLLSYLIISMASFAIFIYAICQPGTYLGLHDNSWGPNFFFSLLGAIAGTIVSYCICLLCSVLPNMFFIGTMLRYIAQNAMIILPTHWWAYYTVKNIYSSCPLYLSTIIVIFFTVSSVEISKYLKNESHIIRSRR